MLSTATSTSCEVDAKFQCSFILFHLNICQSLSFFHLFPVPFRPLILINFALHSHFHPSNHHSLLIFTLITINYQSTDYNFSISIFSRFNFNFNFAQIYIFAFVFNFFFQSIFIQILLRR